MTMKELARLANVSVSTVSKAFKEADDISEQTRQHIFDVARKMGCYGKFYKGKYPKKIIAVIVPELYSHHYAEYVEILQGLIEESGCIMLVSAYHFDGEIQRELLEYYCSYLQVDGVIVFHLKNTIKKGYKTPIVSLLGSGNNEVDTVEVDNRSTIYEAAQKLKALGHKRVAFIGERLTSERQKYFMTAAHEYGLECCAVCSDMRFEKAGEDGIKKLLAQKSKFTAVFCAYDNIAFGAIKQLKREGYKVPEDISVIGVDNIVISGYAETALTTIDFDTTNVCHTAWDIMKEKLKNEYYSCREPHVLNAKLVIRETLSKAKE